VLFIIGCSKQNKDTNIKVIAYFIRNFSLCCSEKNGWSGLYYKKMTHNVFQVKINVYISSLRRIWNENWEENIRTHKQNNNNKNNNNEKLKGKEIEFEVLGKVPNYNSTTHKKLY
jgi:hypothetical protein